LRKLIILLYFMSFSVTAGTLTCSGTVAQIGLHATDRLMIRLSSMNTAVFVCNPNANWSVSGTNYQTGAETCKTMMSMFMTAKATGKSIGNVWFDGDDVPQNCSSWENWKSANVRHFLY